MSGQVEAEDVAAARFLSARTEGVWRPLSQRHDDQAAERHDFDAAEDFRKFIAEVLLAENLVVLGGLGCSLSVQRAGKAVAPSMNDLWRSAEEKAGDRFSKVLEEAKYKPTEQGIGDIEALLSACQLANAYNSTPTLTTFISETEALIVERCRFVDGATDLTTHEAFLRKIARRSTRQPRLKLFTTNYDLCFEAAANRIHFVVVDGFSHTNPQEFDGSYFSYDYVRREPDREAPDYIPNVFHLYKLHGSVDWEQLDDHSIRRSTAPPRPLIVYPRHSKFELSYDQPFLEMMSRLQIGLRQPNTGLLVVGSGFNDSHVAQPILSAVRSNVGLRCLVVGPALEKGTNKQIDELRRLAVEGDHRIGLLAGTFSQLVEKIPDLVADTDGESHRKRLLRGRGSS